MTVDLTRLLNKIVPQPEGEDRTRLRVGVVDTVNADGTVDVFISGVMITDVACLESAPVAAGVVVQILSARGVLLVLGPVASLAVPVEATSSINLGDTTSTSYTNTLTTTGVHGVAFVAPPSGKVQFLGRAAGGSSTVGQYSQLDWEARQGDVVGSGTVVRAANNNTASVFLSSTAGGQGPLNVSGLLTGLTPGNEYNACLTYASSNSGSTATFNRRYVSIVPIV